MTVLSAQAIRRNKTLIMPFSERMEKTSGGIRLTFGLGPCGYDIRLDEDILIWPRWHKLASSREHFIVPLNVVGYVKDKSTWARRWLFVQNTVIEPGWRGYLTLELTNESWRCRRLRAGTPIAQVVFHFLDEPTDVGYTGKYQDQPRGPQEAR